MKRRKLNIPPEGAKSPLLSLPVLAVLATLTVVSFLVPLRPTQSQMEKRSLKEFPEFSVESLLDGSYFDEINLWFSDTFPGRETWLDVASFTASLHGSSEFAIDGDLPTQLATVPTVPKATRPSEPEDAPAVIRVEEPTVEVTTVPTTEATTAPTTEPATVPTTEPTTAPTTEPTTAPTTEPTTVPTTEPTTAPTTEPTTVPTTEPTTVPTTEPTTAPTTEPTTVPTTEPTTAPTEPVWGGVDAGNDAEILQTETVIQIGGSLFSALGFSQECSDRYVALINRFAELVEPMGVTVISAPPPTAVGILVQEEYQAKLRSSSQQDTLNYLHNSMDPRIVTVDTVSALLPHNSEYLYFHTDHHWTALGAYYSYRAVCEAIGMTPVELSALETWDQGEFIGSLYGRAKNPRKLDPDNVIAYIPSGDLVNKVYNDNLYYSYEFPLVSDATQRGKDCKYLAFGTDWPLNHVENRSLTDAPNILVIKDSFGNCFVPFLTENFRNVYAVDYRKFYFLPLQTFVEQYDIDYVLFMPYLSATQSTEGCGCFSNLLR